MKNKTLRNIGVPLLGLTIISTTFLSPSKEAHAISSGSYDYELLADGTAEITGYFSSATSVSIPSTIDGKKVTSIGDDAFNPLVHRTSAKLTSVTIPTTVTHIGKSAFTDLNLTKLTIPNSVVTIEDEAFSDNSIATLTLGTGLKTIGLNAFLSNKLTKVIIPNNVTSIGTQAFKFNSISSLTLGTGVKDIGMGAFNYNQLTSLTIPSNVTSVGDFAFAESKNLTKVTVQNPNLNYGQWVFDVYTGDSHDVVMYASKGSTSETYAKEYNHTFYTSLNDELATKAVEDAEASLDQSDVNYAQNLVNKVEDTTEKASLQQRLNAVQDIINQRQALTDATNAVSLAESTKTLNDFTNAQNLVNALPDSTDKTNLQTRLDALTAYINQQQEAINAVVQAETSHTQADVDTAKPLVDALNDGTVKTDLTNRLNAVQADIDRAKAELEAEQKATEAVVKAEASQTQADVDSARTLVNAVSDTTVKTDLTNRLDKIQASLDAQKAIQDATNAVVQAETTVTQADVDSAKILVNALPDGTVKTDLLARLDVVQNAINEQAIQNATNAVTQAESSKTQADVDSARTLVNALPDSTVKTDLNNRLDKVQADIDTAKAEQDAVNAVEKAESSQVQSDVDSARPIVNALPDGSIKDDLNNRLDKVQNDIDKANAEAEATQATEKAETSKTQADVDSAKTLVNALPDGTVKDDLTNRLDKVQNDIDKANAEAEATQATEKAESSLKKSDVDSARTLVNALPDGTVKDDLNNRLDKVQADIIKSNDGTTSANGDRTIAGIPLNQDLNLEIEGGDLSLTNSDITPFTKIKLSDDTQTVSTDFTAPFTVKDLTGNQLGYRVDVSATQFTDGSNTLPTGTLALKPIDKIERVGTGVGESPVSTLASNQVLDDGTSTLISANKGEGMGVYNLTFPSDALSISVNPTTTKIDGKSAMYTSTISWDLIQAP